MRKIITCGALYRVFGVVNGGDGGGDFFRAAVLCPFPLFVGRDILR